MSRHFMHGVSSMETGVALVLTLLVVAMLTVVVVGFTAVSRLEQVSARNLTYHSSAEQLAQLATGRAMQRLSDAMQAASAAPLFSTQPGQINLFGASPEPLYSRGATGITNVNLFTSTGLITGNTNDNISVGVETVNDSNGDPIGRIAFYIDDESTKIAVNQASGATTNRTLNPQWPRPFAIQGADGVNAVRAGNFNGILTRTANNPSDASNWTYFFTPEQLRGPLTAQPLGQLTVALETNPAPINTAPWGAQKVLINQVPLADQTVQQVAQVLSDPKLSQVFGQTFADKYTPEGLNQLAANLLQLRTDHWRGAPRFNGVDPVLGTSQLGGPVFAAPESGMMKKTNGIPTDFLGYTPFPMLNEVGVSFVYGWNAANQMTMRITLECELYNPFPLNFPGGGQIYAQIDKARFQTVYANPPGQAWRGPNGTSESVAPHNDMVFQDGCDPWGSSVSGPSWWGPAGANTQLNPSTGYHPQRSIPPVPAGGYVVETFNFDVSFTETNPTVSVSQLFVIIDQVKLLATSGDPTSVRDWLSGNDVYNALFGSTPGLRGAQFVVPVGPLSGPFFAPTTPGALPANPPGQVVTLGKLDPRMRPALDASAPLKTTPPGLSWRREQVASIGAANSSSPADFANQPIPSDRGNVQSIIYNTNLPPILSVTNTNSSFYALAADLGKVFTGFPWRSVRLQPQPASESAARMIPDWVMLDALSFSDGMRALNAANPNSQVISAANPVTRRVAPALRSQLDILTNQTLNIVANPTTSGATSIASFTAATARAFQTNAGGVRQVAINAQMPNLTASWATNSSWGTRRTNDLGFPTNALLLPSEIAEIRGMADFVPAANSNSSKLNEYRLSTLFPGASTQSRFYLITAMGEALQLKSVDAPAAAKAFLQTLVEINTNFTPPRIRVINQYAPAE